MRYFSWLDNDNKQITSLSRGENENSTAQENKQLAMASREAIGSEERITPRECSGARRALGIAPE